MFEYEIDDEMINDIRDNIIEREHEHINERIEEQRGDLINENDRLPLGVDERMSPGEIEKELDTRRDNLISEIDITAELESERRREQAESCTYDSKPTTEFYINDDDHEAGVDAMVHSLQDGISILEKEYKVPQANIKKLWVHLAYNKPSEGLAAWTEIGEAMKNCDILPKSEKVEFFDPVGA